MVIKIFKVVTLSAVLWALFFVVSNRDTNIRPSFLQIQKKETETTTNEVQTSVIQKESNTSLIPETDFKSSAPEPTLALSTKEIPIKNILLTQEEGTSDTDENYRPLISPCKVPMGYKIGNFDSRFGIPLLKFKEEIDIASNTWGDNVNKTLFVYNENGPLTINLIYDERQARTDTINDLALEIENSKNSAERIKETYEQEKIIFTGNGEQLAKEAEDFKARYLLYTTKVEVYNTRGGASPSEYESMTRELEALKIISKELEGRKSELLVYMEKINEKVKQYNDLISYTNTLIKKSNELGAKKFTEGKFNAMTNTIDIYQYTNLAKLRRVIAHELGHVIGINHNFNIYSIMYSINSATTTKLSREDLTSLREVCVN